MPRRLDPNAPYWLQIRAAERQIIEYAYSAGGDLAQTATLLGISFPHLRRRVRALGMLAQLGLVKKPKAKSRKRGKKRASPARRGLAAPARSGTARETPARSGTAREKPARPAVDAGSKPKRSRHVRPTPATATSTSSDAPHAATPPLDYERVG